MIGALVTFFEVVVGGAIMLCFSILYVTMWVAFFFA